MKATGNYWFKEMGGVLWS